MSARRAIATMMTVLGLSACGYSGQAAHAPSPDARTAAYVALVERVYAKYNTARGDAYDACVVSVDPPHCHDRGVAMVAVWNQFLKDLDATPPPPQFAADDGTIRTQLPKGIDDLNAMVAAASRNDGPAVVASANAYIGDMQPKVIDALGDVYAPWRTN